MNPEAIALPDLSSIRRRRRRLDWATIAYVSLRLTRFCVGAVLMSWGMFVLFFLAIGGFSIGGLMHQLGNLTGRYLVANADRAASFDHQLLAVHMLVTLTIVFFRRHHFLTPMAKPGSPCHG
ncbi:hypothetical protein [Sphingobium sp. EM0848]|uniref:hypothetical protein n=1 Tax=Sphingobium sp. EM0848 TaxID=2743473 RepID=UPI00159C82B3|nr:hypothetical protein [Sphingobium sp. EM0848]